MEKHILGENGLSYTLGEDEMYYPDLKLVEETHYQIGRYGRIRGNFLKEHRNSVYMELLLDGKLNEYLHGIDEECYQRVELLIEQMKAGAGVTEKLKASDQIVVRHINLGSIRHFKLVENNIKQFTQHINLGSV